MQTDEQATGTLRADGGVKMEAQHETEIEPEPLYETAAEADASRVFPTWLPRTFAEELLEATETPWTLDQLRYAEVNNQGDDDGLEVLMVAEDATRVFIGRDETARDSNGLFGYVIAPDDRLPLVRTAQEAIDLLKPAQAAAAEMTDATAIRQGEWFLVPTDDEPATDAISGEVSERPFGGSPLENHVSTEYALGVSEGEFMQGFAEICPDLAPHVETPAEAFERVAKAFRIASVEGVEMHTEVPDFEALRELAEPIYVRGTLRHRENDHYMERIGDDWHLAVTHDVDVFTMDTSDMTSPVRLD